MDGLQVMYIPLNKDGRENIDIGFGSLYYFNSPHVYEQPSA